MLSAHMYDYNYFYFQNEVHCYYYHYCEKKVIVTITIIPGLICCRMYLLIVAINGFVLRRS